MGKICFLENICTKYLKNVKEEKTNKKKVCFQSNLGNFEMNYNFEFKMVFLFEPFVLSVLHDSEKKEGAQSAATE